MHLASNVFGSQLKLFIIVIALYSISKYLFKGSITAGEKVITVILDLWLGSLCSLDLRTHINTVVIQSIQFVYNIFDLDTHI